MAGGDGRVGLGTRPRDQARAAGQPERRGQLAIAAGKAVDEHHDGRGPPRGRLARDHVADALRVEAGEQHVEVAELRVPGVVFARRQRSRGVAAERLDAPVITARFPLGSSIVSLRV